jgi:hypothetical protein
MSRQRLMVLMVAAALAISGALYLSTQRDLRRDVHGAALLPALGNELNSVTALSVRRGGATPGVTVHERDGRWTVADRGDYPADVSKVRKLLLALSDAKIIEEKTSNPANFPIIGVEDPSLPGATGAEISVAARDGKHAVIIGKPVGEGNFARHAGENKSYIVEPGIASEAEPRYWIDSRLIDIAAAAIQSIEVKPASGPAYVVHRVVAGAVGASLANSSAPKSSPANTSLANSSAAKSSAVSAGAASAGAAGTDSGSSAGTAGAANFVLEGVPPGRKAADPASLAPSSTTYSGLSADDVTPAAAVDFSKATVATVTLSDGSTITLTGATSGDKHWIQAKATKDAALNAKAADRAFEIAGYRYDAIFRPLEQLLVPKEPPPGAKKAAPASSAAASKPASPKLSPSKKSVPAPTS